MVGLIVALAFLMVLSSCSEFQLSSNKKNITVDTVSPKVFTVNFCGNAYMTQDAVEKYALQRASEETLLKDCSHFIILKKRDDSKICMLNPAGNKNKAAPSDRGLSNQYTFQPLMKPNINLTIQCFSKNEELPEGAIDAAEFLMKNFPELRGQGVSYGKK
jgi:hypothetical protein